MNLSDRLLAWLLAVSMSLSASALYAQAQPAPAKDQFEPRVGQEGKDVVWVPSPQTVVNKMLDLAKVTPKDYVIDLGSGDGRTVITAAKLGAKALGIEYNPDMVELSKRNAAKEGFSRETYTQIINTLNGDNELRAKAMQLIDEERKKS